MNKNRNGRGNVDNGLFWESAKENTYSFVYYYDKLVELATTRYEWKNLPPTIDPRYLELVLFAYGCAVFFYDEELGYLSLRSITTSRWNVYGIPKKRTAYATNGYHKDLDEKNSVLIYNNYLHKNSQGVTEYFAKRLSNIDMIIDTNVDAQRTPYIIECEENERMTILNFFKKLVGNEKFIFGRKGTSKGINILNLDAPLVAPTLYDLKVNIWNEALTHLGISNVATNKKERLITDEVNRSLGGVIASRYSGLEMRKQACKQINKMFNLNIDVDYRDEYDTSLEGGVTNE